MKKTFKTIGKEIGTLKRALRRKYYILFKKAYVEKQLRERKGKCGMHGCCNLSVFHSFRNCFDRKNPRKCLKWGNQPPECRIYPFDEEDKIPETRAYCNFYWSKKKSRQKNRQNGVRKKAAKARKSRK